MDHSTIICAASTFTKLRQPLIRKDSTTLYALYRSGSGSNITVWKSIDNGETWGAYVTTNLTSSGILTGANISNTSVSNIEIQLLSNGKVYIIGTNGTTLRIFCIDDDFSHGNVSLGFAYKLAYNPITNKLEFVSGVGASGNVVRITKTADTTTTVWTTVTVSSVTASSPWAYTSFNGFTLITPNGDTHVLGNKMTVNTGLYMRFNNSSSTWTTAIQLFGAYPAASPSLRRGMYLVYITSTSAIGAISVETVGSVQRVLFRYSTDNGDTWSTPEDIGLDNADFIITAYYDQGLDSVIVKAATENGGFALKKIFIRSNLGVWSDANIILNGLTISSTNAYIGITSQHGVLDILYWDGTNMQYTRRPFLFQTLPLSTDIRLKKEVIEEIRTVTNYIEDNNSLTRTIWTDPFITRNATKIKAVHLTELKNAINSIGSTKSPTYSLTLNITQGVTDRSGSHWISVINAIKTVS